MSILPDLRKMLTRAEPLPDDDAGNYATGPGADQAAMDRQLRRPMMMGGLLVLVLAAGLLLWAAFFSITGAVLAPGVVRVENNSKNLSRLEPGIVRQILVREGQKVAKGQLLIRFDDTQTKAAADIFQSVVDSANAQIARFQAEAANAASVTFPADLTARSADPRVAALLASQQTLFQSRMTLYRSQAMVLNSQAQQLETQISGMRIQAQAIDDQARLVREELDGVRELSRQGYAPNSRLLALERSAVQVKGQKGSMLSEMARARQAIGEIRLQIAQLEDRHQTEVSDGIRASQERLADAEPKLRTALQQRQQAEVRAPVAGYVFNLTQFTEGGVAGAGQTLMQIVPTHTQLVVSAEVSPRDITDVKLGMPASVTLLGYNQRKVAPVEGKVSLVSADARSNEKSGISFFLVEITVPAENLAKAGPNVRLAPGMPASVAIVTGERTILDYLLEPFTDSMRSALKER
ncbi:HlyD family type I secretion periplasmic adaptor subunit [Rhizorhabdus dicambivorans]|nr:HlyD family type I secretion periplasmic adaptor subunit [Rhizorhabdus dicambivorans]